MLGLVTKWLFEFSVLSDLTKVTMERIFGNERRECTCKARKIFWLTYRIKRSFSPRNFFLVRIFEATHKNPIELKKFQSWEKFGKILENAWRFSVSDRIFLLILVKFVSSYGVLETCDRRVIFSGSCSIQRVKRHIKNIHQGGHFVVSLVSR